MKGGVLGAKGKWPGSSKASEGGLSSEGSAVYGVRQVERGEGALLSPIFECDPVTKSPLVSGFRRVMRLGPFGKRAVVRRQSDIHSVVSWG